MSIAHNQAIPLETGVVPENEVGDQLSALTILNLLLYLSIFAILWGYNGDLKGTQ